MARLAFALVLAAAMVAVGRIPESAGLFGPARLSIGYGFLLLEAYLVGGLVAKARLPRITGYILTGVVFGPFCFGLIEADVAARMRLIDDLALTFIALTAGAELKLAVLRERRKAIGSIILALTLVVATGVALATGLLRDLLPFARGLGPMEAGAMGALLGVVAVARSPTSAIAIINETRARGRFTDTVFGVTVAMDSLVILLFAVTVSLAEAVVREGAGLDLLFIATVLLQLAVSIGAGVLIGKGVAFYIRRIERDLSIFLVVLAFVITETSSWVSHGLGAHLGVAFHLEPLLIAMAAGFTVQNFSGEGARLTEGLSAISLPIFVVFFSMAGVGLNLGALAGIGGVAVGFVALRMALVSLSGYLGSAAAGEEGRFCRCCGLAFFTQAGVSLGLTQEIVRRFPEWGPGLGTFLVACITLNEMVGPVTFKLALDRMGESGRGAPERREGGKA